MTEKVELSNDMATEYYLGMYRANGRTPTEICWLTSRGDGWIISINEHYLHHAPNERYAGIYGSPCFIYKSGTQFYSKDEAMKCFNQWLDVGRTSEEEDAAMKPEWDEFKRKNKGV